MKKLLVAAITLTAIGVAVKVTKPVFDAEEIDTNAKQISNKAKMSTVHSLA